MAFVWPFYDDLRKGISMMTTEGTVGRGRSSAAAIEDLSSPA